MGELFAKTWVRKFLAGVLMLAGAALVIIPNQMLVVMGMASSAPTYLWMGLTGTGFFVAGWIIWRVLDAVDLRQSYQEAFLVAGVTSAVIIAKNPQAGYGIVMFLGFVSAAFIAVMAYLGFRIGTR